MAGAMNVDIKIHCHNNSQRGMKYVTILCGCFKATITISDSYSRNGNIFTVGAAGVEGTPTMGVLGPQ